MLKYGTEGAIQRTIRKDRIYESRRLLFACPYDKLTQQKAANNVLVQWSQVSLAKHSKRECYKPLHQCTMQILRLYTRQRTVTWILKYKITTAILRVTLATKINIQFILHEKIPAGWVVSMATTGVLVQECLMLTDTTVKVYITYSSKPDTTKAVTDPSYRTLFCDSSSVLRRMESLYRTTPFGWRGCTHLSLIAVEFTLFAVKFRGGEGSVNKRKIGCK